MIEDSTRKRRIFLIVFVALVVVIAAGFVAWGLAHNGEGITSSTEARTEGSLDYRRVTYNGKTYKYNTSVKSVLFVGVGEKSEVTVDDMVPNAGPADALFLFVMDDTTRTTQIVEIPTSSMVEVKMYDDSNNLLLTEDAPIGLQYAFADGGSRSSQFTKDSVSQLMGRVPIRAYIAMEVAGLTTVVDAMGGVTITFTEDYTDMDSSFVEGETVILTGPLAQQFVATENDTQMKRQQEFIQAFFLEISKMAKEDPDKLSAVLDLMDQFLRMDMNSETMDDLLAYPIHGEIISIPGTEKTVSGQKEFQVDTEELLPVLVDLFYTED